MHACVHVGAFSRVRVHVQVRASMMHAQVELSHNSADTVDAFTCADTYALTHVHIGAHLLAATHACCVLRAACSVWRGLHQAAAAMCKQALLTTTT
jgi:hypothetical protein